MIILDLMMPVKDLQIQQNLQHLNLIQYRKYFSEHTPMTQSEDSIVVDGNNVTTKSGVTSYVNPILKEKLGDNLSINEETVDYFYYADSAIITFGGIPSDTDFDPGTGSMTFKKSADGFHYSFEVDTVIEDMIATYTFSVSYPV